MPHNNNNKTDDKKEAAATTTTTTTRRTRTIMMRRRALFAGIWGSLLLLIRAQTDVSALPPWPCPGPCWITEDTRSRAAIDQLSGQWAPGCPLCSDYTTIPCGFGQVIVTTPTDGPVCRSCGSAALTAAHRVSIPTVFPSCTAPNATMCARNYFADPANQTGACLPCLAVTPGCPDGYYPRPCVTAADSLTAQCAPCMLPVLPNNNGSVHMYGAGFAFGDCSQQPLLSLADTSGCAYFQTPKWGTGYCAVWCRPGFAMVAAAVGALGLPTCRACATACPPGFYPPPCPGGFASGLQSPNCLACDAGLLPLNANWTTTPSSSSLAATWCTWQCSATGYFALNGICVPCPSAFSYGPLRCLQAGLRWLGCGGSSGGGCAPCTAACVRGATYLRADVYLPACQCAPCDAPTPGATFIVRNCTNVTNTLLDDCGACAPGVSFQAARCSPVADTLCVPCTPPAPGRLLLAPCVPSADARYGACPAGLACNGSATPFACTAPLIASAGGVCVCPPATTMMMTTGGCVPIACRAGTFPDPQTDGCTPCPAAAGLVMTTRPGVLGFDACGCVPGYIRRVAYVGVAQGDNNNNGLLTVQQQVACWPCGDLGCAFGLQRQTPCDGFGYAEPECVCGVGPGMALSVPARLDAPCAVTCAPGFRPAYNNNAAVTPGLFDLFSFVLFPSSSTTTSLLVAGGGGNTKNNNNLNNNNNNKNGTTTTQQPPCAPFRRAVPILDAAVLAVCDNAQGDVLVIRTDSGEWEPLNLTLFEIETQRAEIRGRDLVAHADQSAGGLVWFLFGYWGLCGPNLDTAVPGPCAAFELLLFAPAASTTATTGCAAGVCVLQGSFLWGNQFPAEGLQEGAGTPTVAAWAPSGFMGARTREGALFFFFLAENDNNGDGFLQLARYDIVFYDATIKYDARAADPVTLLGPAAVALLPGLMGIRALAPAMDGLYVAGSNSNGVVGVWRVACVDAACALGLSSAQPAAWSSALLATTTTTTTTGNNNNTADGSGDVVVGMHTLPASTTRHLLVLLLLSGGGMLTTRTVDLWNGLVAPGVTVGGIWAMGGGGLTAIVSPQTTTWWRPGEVQACGLDGFATLAAPSAFSSILLSPLTTTTGGCRPLQCVREMPCGANSVRAPGATACGCLPGYALDPSSDHRACLPCADAHQPHSSPSYYYYCPGGNAPPTPCQPHAMVLLHSDAPAASASDCVCLAGFLLFRGVCLPCPTSLWCPFNGTLAPLACHGGGTTLTDGSVSPLDCLCPPRTYGLACLPCDDSMECGAYPIRLSLVTLAIDAWGPIASGSVLDACLLGFADATTLVYPVLGISTASLQTAVQQSASALAWSWIVVLPAGAAGNLTACLAPQFAALDARVLFAPRDVRIVQAQSCGGAHWEWNGDVHAQACTCVAGYQQMQTVLFGVQCVPCLNGTARARRSPGGCLPCAADANEHAPFLGMSACACVPGFERGGDAGLCVPLSTSSSSSSSSSDAPGWYTQFFSAPTALVLTSLGAGTAALVFSVVLACML